LSKVLSKPPTVYATYLLDDVLPQTAKLSKALQAVELDLSAIASLVGNTLNMLDAATVSSANWILQLQDVCEELATKQVGVSVPAALDFAEKVGKPYISKLKVNICSRFSSQNVVAAFSIFDPTKIPSINSAEIKTYGESSLDILMSHYATQKASTTLSGAEHTKEAILSDETIIE